MNKKQSEQEKMAILYANNLLQTKKYIDFVAEKYEPPENVKSCLNTMMELYRIMALATVNKGESK